MRKSVNLRFLVTVINAVKIHSIFYQREQKGNQIMSSTLLVLWKQLIWQPIVGLFEIEACKKAHLNILEQYAYDLDIK
jgi:hypothetical protein